MFQYFLRAAALGVAVLCGMATPAAAQVPLGGPIGPPSVNRPVSPPFSPYLNLARRGTDPALNYYGLVRPQVEFRNNFQNLQQQVLANRQGINQLAADPAMGGLPVTGHAAVFLNTGGYFLNMSGAGVGGSNLGTAPTFGGGASRFGGGLPQRFGGGQQAMPPAGPGGSFRR